MTSPQMPKRSRHVWLRRSGWIAGSLAAGLAAYAGIVVAGNNFHSVVAGEFYRSAQPDAADIADFRDRYGIRTIVNLRGAQENTQWYDAEIAAAGAEGIAHVDFRMSAGRRLGTAERNALIAIFESAEKPILVHCQSGIDRTGLASALYLAAVAKVGEAAAEAQLSILYGHVGLPGLYAFEMDTSFEDAEPSLGFFGS